MVTRAPHRQVRLPSPVRDPALPPEQGHACLRGAGQRQEPGPCHQGPARRQAAYEAVEDLYRQTSLNAGLSSPPSATPALSGSHVWKPAAVCSTASDAWRSSDAADAASARASSTGSPSTAYWSCPPRPAPPASIPPDATPIAEGSVRPSEAVSEKISSAAAS